MANFDNPKNVRGMASLLLDENEINDASLEIDEIENSIVSGKERNGKEQEVDFVDMYTKNIERVGRQATSIDEKSKFSLDDDDDLSIDKILGKTTVNKPIERGDEMVDRDKKWSAEEPEDPMLADMTVEERKQDQINKVIGKIDKVGDDSEFLNQEDEEDEIARITEQVDLLRNNLENEGINLERIPEITPTTSKKEAKNILKILQIKNDRLRYCDFFEEGILAVAYGLESVFNGQREIFGSKIDLTGYSDTVKVKLRRMRYDTSTFVSNIMQGYNISSGWRIVLELIPSLFLYSRDRRLKANDNLISDEAYKKALQEL